MRLEAKSREQKTPPLPGRVHRIALRPHPAPSLLRTRGELMARMGAHARVGSLPAHAHEATCSPALCVRCARRSFEEGGRRDLERAWGICVTGSVVADCSRGIEGGELVAWG